MTKQKRRTLVPKNIATMSDTEYNAWCRSLSYEDQDKLAERTFKTPPEWFVYWHLKPEAVKDKWDEDLQGPNIHDTEADAVKEFEEISADPDTLAARVEKCVGNFDVLDRSNLRDRDYTTIREYGTFPE